MTVSGVPLGGIIRFFPVITVAAALILSACGGSTSGTGIQQQDNVDGLPLEVSQFWDSAPRGVTVLAAYEFASPTASSLTSLEISQAGFGRLDVSRFALFEDEQRLLSDDFGDAFLELGPDDIGQAIDVGEATRPLAAGCHLRLSQALRLQDGLNQGRLVWVLEETVNLDDNGSQPTCAEVLDARMGFLLGAGEEEFPYDLVALIGLQAVDTLQLTQLRSWTLTHSQVVAKYYRLLGDAAFELAGPAQRIPIEVFEPPDRRADRFQSQLGL